MTTQPLFGTRLRPIKHSVLLLLLLLLGIPMPLRAAQLVAARYVRMTGTEVVVEISISEPPPPTLIVVQRLPAQASVLQAQPPTNSVNSSKGMVKWLLRGVRSGTLAIRLTLEQPVTGGEVSGEVRYRAAGGGMVTIPIARQ